MADNTNAGNQIDESAELFGDDSNNLNWLEKDSISNEESGDLKQATDELPFDEEDGEGNKEDEVQGTIQPVKKPLTREDQSWKDKYYHTQGQLQSLSERLAQIEQAKQANVELPSVDDNDIESTIRETWGEDPALIALARKNKELESKIIATQQVESQKVSATVYNVIESFVNENKNFLDNPEIGNLFIDEMNDRLPNGDFGKLVNDAKAGKILDANVINVIKTKLEKSLAVATGKGIVNNERKVKSNQRVKQRAQGPSAGVIPAKEAVTKTEKPLSYQDAFRATQVSGFK